MQQPSDDQTTAEADSLSGSIDDLRDAIAQLNEKVDAMMLAMLQLKR